MTLSLRTLFGGSDEAETPNPDQPATPPPPLNVRGMFEVTGGSVMGANHFQPLVLHNCQDAYHYAITPDVLVAIVCDGCTSGTPDNHHSHTEFGAMLASRMFVCELEKQFGSRARSGQFPTTPEDASRLLERARQNVLASLRSLIASMCCVEAGESLNALLTNFCMFTVVGAVIGKDYTHAFNVGDGTMIINGTPIAIGPFPENKPPYIAYELTGSSLDPAQLRFTVQATLPTQELQSIILGSDAVADEFIPKEQQNLPGKSEPLGSVNQFIELDRYYINSDALRRRLALAQLEYSGKPRGGAPTHVHRPLFDDDLTIVAIRRQKQGAS